ncbi:DNA gyrase inhibitor YacG [Aliiglaciecola sp. CAU 1673]|uniref:DNA gyrase inhibitor YacG n=1 Tax=Aliiglaciecola sp. CAU 1673 TaxID=3032595 RepID=UPI0023DA9DD4|nr:DNA gyrase inhibitor YacG [Aliiglaciecola sp. CAU 1673]MDF2178422.1 DNA gyrase inhibitor YacG [Aliiglaciecola sp. CAU 1673]
MKVKCPTCQKDVEWGEKSPYRPFCSKRCQLIDLGEWAAEEHKVPGAPAPELSMDIEDIEALLSKQSQDFFK